MPTLSAIISRLSTLSVNNTSPHPTATDSSRGHPELFEADEPQEQVPYAPFVTDVIVKHSSVFNSRRAGGMSSLEQLQFVQMLKDVIVDEAPMIFGGIKDFKVVTARQAKEKPKDAPLTLDDELLHVAMLVMGSEDAWRVVSMSEGTEYLVDAVEDLWEKVLALAGKQREKVKVGGKLPVLNELGEEVGRFDSGTTLAMQV